MLSSPGKGFCRALAIAHPKPSSPGSAELRKSDTVPEASDKLDLEGSENNALTTFVFA